MTYYFTSYKFIQGYHLKTLKTFIHKFEQGIIIYEQKIIKHFTCIYLINYYAVTKNPTLLSLLNNMKGLHGALGVMHKQQILEH